MLEMEPLFISILGTPACGKSYYLAALTWQLRQMLPQFALSFTDVEPLINQSLTDNEEARFLNPQASEFHQLTELIGKTKLAGEMYNTVSYGSQTVIYSRPYLFALRPLGQHPRLGRANGSPQVRVMCLYDNAGEHFQPGRESTATPVTQHLTRAELLLYLFDPTQDARFRVWMGASGNASTANRASRQELILQEAATRIRRALALSATARHDRPLIVVLTKCDAWMHKMPTRDWSLPWKSGPGVSGLHTERIEQCSDLRALLLSVCPDIVQAAESFAREVVYVPVSALGHAPRETPPGPAIRPADIKPIWVPVPVLYGLYRWCAAWYLA